MSLSFSTIASVVILVNETDQRQLEQRAELALHYVIRWIENHKLHLAPEKTEVAVLRGPWKKTDREVAFLPKSNIT